MTEHQISQTTEHPAPARTELVRPTAPLIAVVTLLLVLGGSWSSAYQGYAASRSADAVTSSTGDTEHFVPDPGQAPASVQDLPPHFVSAPPPAPARTVIVPGAPAFSAAEPNPPSAAPPRAATEPARTGAPRAWQKLFAGWTTRTPPLRDDRVMLLVMDANGGGGADAVAVGRLTRVESLLAAELVRSGFVVATPTSGPTEPGADPRQLAERAAAALLVIASISAPMETELSGHDPATVWSGVELRTMDVRSGAVLGSVRERTRSTHVAPAALPHAAQRAAEAAASRLAIELAARH